MVTMRGPGQRVFLKLISKGLERPLSSSQHLPGGSQLSGTLVLGDCPFSDWTPCDSVKITQQTGLLRSELLFVATRTLKAYGK